MRESIEAAIKAVHDFETDSGVLLGGTWHQRLASLAEKGYLRQPLPAAVEIVHKVNLMVHELHAERWGGVAFRVIDTEQELIPNAVAEADLYLQALTVPRRAPLDGDEVKRAAALAWLHELGINADGFTGSLHR